MAAVEFQPGSGNIKELENQPSNNAPEEILVQGRSELLKWVKHLELCHCVEIPTDTMDLACSIVLRYYDKFTGTTEAPILDKFIEEFIFLLQKALSRLRDDFEKHEELRRLDKEGYLLFCNLVELCEFRKERLQYAPNYLSRIEEEYKLLRDVWGGFVENFIAVATWKEDARRMDILVKIWGHLCHILESQSSRDDLIGEVHSIQTLVDEYKRNIPAIVMQHLTVSPLVVAKVASIDTGTPASWLLNSFKPPLDGLRDRMARRVVGQDQIIEKIASRISRNHGSGSSPLASFLFLPVSNFGVVELAQSLAEELYDSKDRFVRFILPEYVENSGPNNEGRGYKHDKLREDVLGVVKTKQFCVLLIQNVDEYEYAAEFLDDMLTKGKLIGTEGKSCELSNTLIILTCSTGVNGFDALSCKCLEMDCPKNKAAKEAASSEDHDCDVLPLHKMVLETRRCVSEMVDEVLVLNNFTTVDQDLNTRIWLREIIDECWKCHRHPIFYPSQAFVHLMATCSGKVARRYAMITWFKSRVIRELYDGVDGVPAANGPICRIDVLAGTWKSFSRPLEVDDRVNSALEAFRATLNQWKAAYRFEKRSTEVILDSRRKHKALLALLEDTKPDYIVRNVTDLKNRLGCIIADAVNSENLDFEQLLVSFCLMDDVVADLRKGN